VTRTSLDESYRNCKKLSRSFGSTYYWSAAVLEPAQRKHVYALYAFCRSADDIVDVGDAEPLQRREALQSFGDQFFTDLAAGTSNHPILEAVVNSARELQLPLEYFERFLRSMAMDLEVQTYNTFNDLLVYMDGSAAVIGEMMVPVLQPTSPDAIVAARNLGVAFQLTNFLRDVGEDLDRDRVYIPQETLRTYGADPWTREVTPEWVSVMRHEIDRTRMFYDDALSGIDALQGRAQGCVRAAHQLYGQILDRIEANDYDVFTKRARVPQWKKLAVAGSSFRG
jgi:phytoene synthase